jgi:hypothetical protein
MLQAIKFSKGNLEILDQLQLPLIQDLKVALAELDCL